jgi:hypothetical protein
MTTPDRAERRFFVSQSLEILWNPYATAAIS